MARIPKRISRQVLPSGRVGDVPIPFDIADTGAGIEAQGLGALGGGLTNLGKTLDEIRTREQRADDVLTSDNVSFTIQSAKDKFAAFKESSPDPKTWTEGSRTIWDDASSVASKLVFNDKDIGERVLFNFRAEQQHSSAIAGIQAADATSKIAVKATGNTLIKTFARGENTDIAILTHKEALKNELGDDDLVKIAMSKTVAMAEVQRIAVLITQGDFKSARELAEATTGLTATERRAQLNIIDSAETRARNKAQTTSDFVQESSSTNMVDQLIEDPDAVGQQEFNDLPFDEESEAVWSTVLNDRIKTLKAGKPDPFTQESGIVLDALQVQLQGNIDDLPSVNEIVSRIGKGITPDDAKRFIDTRNRRLDKDDVLNRAVVKDIYKYYDDLKGISVFATLTAKQKIIVRDGGTLVLTPEQELENINDFLEIKRDFTSWLIRNEGDIKTGKISDNDIEVRGRELTQGTNGKEEQITLGFWEKSFFLAFNPVKLIAGKQRDTNQKRVEKLSGTNPRSQKQFLEIVGKLKGIDINAAEDYLQEHRSKFGI